MKALPGLLALCVLSAQGHAGAATYHVAPNGSDAASGALDAPWKSIAHAQTMAAPGDTVYFRGGRYAYSSATTGCAHNYDPYTSNGAGQSADGFGAHIKADQPGNVFRGCRAWANTDDGFDLIKAYSAVTIEHSWAWMHGYLPGTSTPLAAGNGNGIKAGGYGGVYVANGVKHTVRFSAAFNNKAAGFYANHHPLAIEFFNNTAFGNQVDFNLRGIAPDGSVASFGILRNNIGRTLSYAAGADQAYNSWTLPVKVSDADFAGVSGEGWDAPRQADGALPVLSSHRLRPGSPLIDKGVAVGLPYTGSAPDLGAFEHGGPGQPF